MTFAASLAAMIEKKKKKRKKEKKKKLFSADVFFLVSVISPKAVRPVALLQRRSIDQLFARRF